MKKALVFYGGWEGHTPKETAEVFAKMLEEHNFQTIIEKGTKCLDDSEVLAEYDLFVPVFSNGEITLTQSENICAAVEVGAGLAGCHGMSDAFRKDLLWHFMTGGHFVCHPEDHVEYRVSAVKGSFLGEGMEDFVVDTEQYYLQLDPAVQVHATTIVSSPGPHASNGAVTMPVIYTKYWGKGRVFYSSLGHTYRDFEHVQIREWMLRGMLWAAGGKNV